MTSVRPKLKPDTPKAVTAWETATGQNVWMTEDGSWTKDPARIGAFTGDIRRETPRTFHSAKFVRRSPSGA